MPLHLLCTQCSQKTQKIWLLPTLYFIQIMAIYLNFLPTQCHNHLPLFLSTSYLPEVFWFPYLLSIFQISETALPYSAISTRPPAYYNSCGHTDLNSHGNVGVGAVFCYETYTRNLHFLSGPGLLTDLPSPPA